MNAEGKTKTRKIWGRFLIRTALGLLAAVVLLAVAAVFALQTRPVREMLANRITAAVAAHTPFVCRIGELRGSLISSFEIRDLDLRVAKTGDPVIAADRVAISYSIPMLLGRVLWINRLTLAGASVHLVQAPSGSWNFEIPEEPVPQAAPPVTPAQDAGLPFKLFLRRLAVEDSDLTLVWQLDDGPVVHHFTGIHCQARLGLGNTMTADIRRLKVRMDFPDIDVKGLSGRARLDFASGRLDVENVRIQGERSDFSVSGRMEFPEEGPDPFLMDLSADITAMSLGEFGRAFPIQMPDTDIVSGHLAVNGPVARMDCRADLRMDRMQVMSQGRVTISETNDVGLELIGKTRALDLSALPALDLDAFPSALDGDFVLVWERIGASDQTGKIILNLAPSRIWDYGIEKAHLEADIQGPDFLFKTIDLAAPAGKLAAEGILAGFMDGGMDNRIAFSADVKNLDPGLLFADGNYAGDINGRADFTIQIPRTFDAAEITAEAAAMIADSRWMGVDIAKMDVDADWAGGAVRFRRFDLETAQARGSITGEASLADQTCRLKANVTVPDLSLLYDLLPDATALENLSGSAVVTSEISGNWTSPEITAGIDAETIAFGEIFAGRLTASGAFRGGLPEFRMTAEGVAQDISIKGFRIPALTAKASGDRSSLAAEMDIRAKEGMRLAWGGTIQEWLGPEKIAFVDALRVEIPDQPPLVNRDTAQVLISGDRIAVEGLVLDSGEASLFAFGRMDLVKPGAVAAAVNLKDLDIRRFSGFWPKAESLEGRVSGDLQLSGVSRHPVMALNLSLDQGKFKNFPLPAAVATFSYQDSQMDFDVQANRNGATLLDAAGTLGMEFSLQPFRLQPHPGGLDARVSLENADISWISEFINHPEYHVTGVLGGDAALFGDLLRPSVQGRMMLSEGALELKKQGLVYETLVANLEFSEHAIILKDLQVEGDQEGEIHLSGKVNHENFHPRSFDLRAEGRNFYVPFHAGVDARMHPDLRLTGTWEAPMLQGKITVPEGRVNLERVLAKQVSEIKVVAPVSDEDGLLRVPESEPPAPAFVNPLAADVSVVVPKDFWFWGKDEFIEIKGDVQLKKEPRKPFVLYGSVVPVRGTYRFRGRLFQITDGELTFLGREDINPIVNIEAQTEIGDVTIIIRLSGTFEHLNLVLDSDPAMDPSDIISYLVFGRGSDDLSEKESFQAEEAALSFTGQIAADKLRDIIGDTLGIDYLNISAGSGGLRQGSLTMGKYVLPRVFVMFRQGFDESVNQQLEVTYEINKYFDLETQINSEQTSALDLIWKYEF